MAFDRTALGSRSTSILLVVSMLALACTQAPKSEAETTAAADTPDPGVVCQHVRTLAAKDNSDELALDNVQRQCVQALTGLQSRYASFAGCVEAAATSAAVLECEKALAKPPPLLAAASPTAQVEDVCAHVINLLSAEIPQMGSSVGASEIEALRQRCITDAAAKLQSIGVEAFTKQSECLFAATNLQALQACGSF